jgi:hypothetical protein
VLAGQSHSLGFAITAYRFSSSHPAVQLNLVRAAGSDEENLYAVIWNPGD